MMSSIRRRLIVACTFIVTTLSAPAAVSHLAAAEWDFQVRFTQDVHPRPYTGRVYLFFSRTRPQPRKQWWFFNLRQEPLASIAVENWKPDEPLTFSTDNEELRTFPKAVFKKDLTAYRVQAVVRFNPLGPTIGNAEGNGYSEAATLKDPAKTISLVVDQIVPQYEFHETRWTKLLQVRSKLLSEFHGQDVYLNAAVTLPASYDEQPERRYPTIFQIPGFGGTHFSGVRQQPVDEENKRGVEFLRVMLDGSCPLGHHVFADSANNGPYGTAFIREFLPAFDRQFRSIAEPNARFLTGHSSGGWSSLWLMIRHPDDFAGTWSTSPDPVDFRDFQRINLYRPGENMYLDQNGDKRPLARQGSRVIISYKDFARNEWVLGDGGQLHSFEAVFSPRGPDGKPLLLWDRQTGVVNSNVAKTWEKYDIRLVLERNWQTLGPKLAGKLHVFMGELDTFYLDGAMRLLKESLEKLGSDAVVEIHAGQDHGSLLSPQLRSRIRREMTETFLRHHPEYKPLEAVPDVK